jgi:uncharacterized membrane protein YeaQ/YmgE (transglycosylase-associated protein family)
MGVDLAAMILAGIGLSWALQQLYTYLSRTRVAVTGATVITAILGAVILFPAYRNLTQYSAAGRALQKTQLDADAHDGRDIDKLVRIVQSRHDGRVYSGLRGNWGKEYRVGWVPVHAWFANREVDAIGFTFRTVTSLSTDIEVAFDETNLAQYEMLNVRYVILPAERLPAVPATFIMQSGRHRLYEVKTSGYFQAVDRSTAVSADRTNIEPATLDFRKSQLALQNIYPGVAFSGAQAPPSTFSGSAPPAGIPGMLLAQSNRLKDGIFDAAVDMKRPAAVLLKATYDPRWTATVDGKNAKPVMMAPSVVGVDVPAGLHSVSFRYKPYPWYPLLIAIGLVTLVALILIPRRRAW